jgi:hypothetical protein
MLVGELDHTLRNLDFLRNMNSASAERFSSSVSEPVYKRLEDVDKGFRTELALTAKGLNLRVDSVEGDVSVLSVQAGKIETRVSNAERDSSVALQEAGKFSWIVADGESASSFTLTKRMASLISGTINLNGFVTFTNLKEADGKTTINGGNITSGTISGVTLQSIAKTTAVVVEDGCVSVYTGGSKSPGSMAGGLCYDTNGNESIGESPERLFLHTTLGTALKIQANGANISIEAVGSRNWVYAMGNWSFFDANVVAPRSGW